MPISNAKEPNVPPAWLGKQMTFEEIDDLEITQKSRIGESKLYELKLSDTLLRDELINLSEENDVSKKFYDASDFSVAQKMIVTGMQDEGLRQFVLDRILPIVLGPIDTELRNELANNLLDEEFWIVSDGDITNYVLRKREDEPHLDGTLENKPEPQLRMSLSTISTVGYEGWVEVQMDEYRDEPTSFIKGDKNFGEDFLDHKRKFDSNSIVCWSKTYGQHSPPDINDFTDEELNQRTPFVALTIDFQYLIDTTLHELGRPPINPGFTPEF